MKKYRIIFYKTYTPSPMSFWVHCHLDSEVWNDAKVFDPPLPKAIPCKGFPMLIVNAFGTNLIFSSVKETEHFLEVISQKNMPTTIRLSADRKTSVGPNGHWLSRLPSELKRWKKREKIIPLVKSGLKELKAMYAQTN